MKGFVISIVDIKLMSTVGIELMLHIAIGIYLTIQLDVNMMLPNLMYVHEINTRIIFLCISIIIISEINEMDFNWIHIIITN